MSSSNYKLHNTVLQSLLLPLLRFSISSAFVFLVLCLLTPYSKLMFFFLFYNPIIELSWQDSVGNGDANSNPETGFNDLGLVALAQSGRDVQELLSQQQTPPIQATDDHHLIEFSEALISKSF